MAQNVFSWEIQPLLLYKCEYDVWRVWKDEKDTAAPS